MARGFALHAGVPADVIRQTARTAESLGYGSFWVNYPGPVDGLAALAAAVPETTRIALGVGVVPLHTCPPGRHRRGRPCERAAPGSPPAGRGEPEPGGAGPRPGRHRRPSAQHLRARLYVAALGPRMCRLAGEVADGVLLNWLTPEHARQSAEWVREGAQRRGPARPAAGRVRPGRAGTGRRRPAGDGGAPLRRHSRLRGPLRAHGRRAGSDGDRCHERGGACPRRSPAGRTRSTTSWSGPSRRTTRSTRRSRWSAPRAQASSRDPAGSRGAPLSAAPPARRCLSGRSAHDGRSAARVRLRRPAPARRAPRPAAGPPGRAARAVSPARLGRAGRASASAPPWSSSTSPWPGPTRAGRRSGSAVDSVVEATARVLAAARAAGIFTVFTTWAYDPAAPALAARREERAPSRPRRREAPRARSADRAPADRAAPPEALRVGLQGHEPPRDARRPGHRHADRHRGEHEPLRLRHVPRRHRQLPGHRAARGGRGALRDLPRGQPARHRAGSRRRACRSTR